MRFSSYYHLNEWRSDSWLENKTESREEKCVVKIWELDSDNSGVERDSSNESDTDELSDLLRPIGILSVPERFLYDPVSKMFNL